MYDVAVIGAGVVGGLIARELARYRLKICILEKGNDVGIGSTKANSAIVHAGFDAKEGTLKAKLNVRGSELMPSIASQLGVKYKNNGSLVLGFDDGDAETIQMLYRRGISNGVKNLRVLNRDELLDIEPNVSPEATCALYAPTGAIICPYELNIAAVGNAMDNGAELKLNFEVTDIRISTDGYDVFSNSQSIRARYVINAAGINADKVAKMIGDDSFDIHPRKGEYILMDKDCGGIVSHTIFTTPNKMGKGILVTPTVDGNLLCGPTSVDTTDKNDKSTTSDGLSQIMEKASKSVQNIPFRSSITSFCGLRAVGNTDDFIINSPRNGFINVAGIESPGLSASPAIAAYVIEILADSGLSLDENSEFSPFRKPMHYFREADIEEKNSIIRKDKTFGHIVCRCESVTEGEILEAIRTNPKPRDLDGIKYRTRAQMGRCQGGFCVPYIIELLARENGVPYESITKCGGNSVINITRTKEDVQ